MMVIYVFSALLVFFYNIGSLPHAVVEVVAGVFGLEAAKKAAKGK